MNGATSANSVPIISAGLLERTLIKFSKASWGNHSTATQRGMS